MKISVMANGMVKVEGSTLAEEVEMRNKLQAQGKTCTPIEYEGSVEDCLDWIMGKSESELDEVEDEDDLDEYDDDYEDEEDEDEDVYVLTDEDGQELEIEIDEVLDYLAEKLSGYKNVDYSDVEEAVENYLWNRPEITEDDFYYLVESGQVEELTDRFYSRL
jgi:hypothetical protein